MPEAIAYYDAGADVTVHCAAAVAAKRFVKISGTRAPGDNVEIAHADPGERVFGVAAVSTAAGGIVNVMRSPKVVPVTALGALNAFQEVQVGANGMAMPLSTGIAIGYVLADCPSGGDAQVSLYSRTGV